MEAYSPIPQIPFISGKRILIIGAGISGLTFATAIQKLLPTITSSPTFIPPQITIYERDTKAMQPTRQGYSLSIRSDGRTGGLQTLQKLGLLEAALVRSVTGSQRNKNAGNFCLWDRRWREILRIKLQAPEGLPVSGIRIARNALRQTLVEAVVESGVAIKWETKVTGAEKLEDGKMRVLFEGGGMEECDILVAADGSRSKVRAALRPDDMLKFQNVVGILGTSRFEGEIPPPANKDWGLMVSGTGTGLFVSPVDEHSVAWGVSYRTSEQRSFLKQPIGKKDTDKLLKEALERGSDIPEPFKTYIRATDMEMLQLINFMDKPPFEHNRGNLKDTNVVFIGDANHAVTPFAGSGACLALSDGWDLAEQLVGHGALEDALKAYDKLSVSRANQVLKFSHFTIKYAHAKGFLVWVLVFGFKIVFQFLTLLGWIR